MGSQSTMSKFEDSSILITGGTGSFGKAFVRHALDVLKPRRLAILSRDELKQSDMRKDFVDDRIRWFIGDIRDRDRLMRAFSRVDYIVHAAALKQVDTAEYNPFEYVKTNVLGSQNVIDAAIDSGVKQVVALSTDKASSPINLYGATKLTADKLFVAENNYATSSDTNFSVVRYGNVVGSRGSVIPFFKDCIAQGRPLPITDREMTRFWITLPQAVDFVIDAFESMNGGELYVPRIPSMRVTDLTEALAPGYPTVDVGIRPGEKLHEEMISAEDSARTIRQETRYVVKPTVDAWWFTEPAGTPVERGFSYRSDTNDQWLTGDQLRALVDEI
jgi:UDP-N-acetylglucosamine 4,6-dehydratase